MSNQNNSIEQKEATMAIPLFCPRDGDVLYAGTKTISGSNFNAWLCPTCDYWKLRTVTSI